MLSWTNNSFLWCGAKPHQTVIHRTNTNCHNRFIIIGKKENECENPVDIPYNYSVLDYSNFYRIAQLNMQKKLTGNFKDSRHARNDIDKLKKKFKSCYLRHAFEQVFSEVPFLK